MKAPQFSALERGAVALVTTAFLALSGSAEPAATLGGFTAWERTRSLASTWVMPSSWWGGWPVNNR